MHIPATEEAQHLRAFEIYYQLGDKRTLAKVAEKVGRSPDWVSTVAKAFDWKRRVNERDHRQSESILDRIDEYKLKEKENNLKLIRATKARYAQLLMSQKITAAEFEKIVKLEMLITGEATERHGLEDTLADLVSDAKRRRSRHNMGND